MAGVTDLIDKSQIILSSEANLIVTLFFFTLTIVAYSVFIYYFYRFMARKNIITLNLNQYNNYENPATVKFFAAVFYVIEYIILLPILSIFWFAFLSILILLLAEGITASTTLMIAASLVASVRVTSYVSQNLSRDLAKMVPLTLLAIAITKPGFFDITNLLSKFYEIPALLSQVPYFLLFIIGIEFIMRVAELISQAQSNKTGISEED